MNIFFRLANDALLEQKFVRYNKFSIDRLQVVWYKHLPFGAVVVEPGKKSRQPEKKLKKVLDESDWFV